MALLHHHPTLAIGRLCGHIARRPSRACRVRTHEGDQMTDPNRPRWTVAQKRETRYARRGKEAVHRLPRQREDRRFSVGVTTSPSLRTSSSSNSNAATVVGAPVVYGTPYTVYDGWGSFIEVVQRSDQLHLATADCRFLYNHQSLTIARTSSSTLTLPTPRTRRTGSATLDPRQTVASNLVLAIERGDVNQMSVGFVVAENSWNEDFSYRTITRFGELMNVSPVAFPAVANDVGRGAERPRTSAAKRQPEQHNERSVE